MTALTHAVYYAPTGETKSEHPDASSAFAAAARIGGAKYGYVVGPVGCPPELRAESLRAADRTKPEAPVAAVAKNQEGPGLFDL